MSGIKESAVWWRLRPNPLEERTSRPVCDRIAPTAGIVTGLILSYDFELGSTSASLSLTDYYFFESPFFDFGGVKDGIATGTHLLEVLAEISGPESFPLALAVGWNFHNDPDKSTWAAVSAERDNTTWLFFLGL
ncbi:MAG: hypothetical protein IH968_01340 [Gemmatimonadetes bacterium]|nr:hypothetical protein [Gemmatimonadota bacterium]